MFSVIIPYYNKEKYVERCIASVLNQTFQDFEIILVDDGSTDNGCAIIREKYGNKVTLISQKNQGVSQARNKGISMARFNYIAFLDADDCWHIQFLEKVKEVVDGDGEFDESDIDDIFSYEGDVRQFRGSIYIDGVVPETDDKEFDRKAALKVMEFFAKKTDANQYVGGVGFKKRDITNPFDKDF